MNPVNTLSKACLPLLLLGAAFVFQPTASAGNCQDLHQEYFRSQLLKNLNFDSDTGDFALVPKGEDRGFGLITLELVDLTQQNATVGAIWLAKPSVQKVEVRGIELGGAFGPQRVLEAVLMALRHSLVFGSELDLHNLQTQQRKAIVDLIKSKNLPWEVVTNRQNLLSLVAY